MKQFRFKLSIYKKIHCKIKYTDRWLKQQPLKRKSSSDIATVSTKTTKTDQRCVQNRTPIMTIKNLKRLGDTLRIILCFEFSLYGEEKEPKPQCILRSLLINYQIIR